MVSEVGVINVSSSVTSTPVAVAPVSTLAVSPNFASAVSSSPGSITTSSSLIHTPRIVEDPAAGFITEYLSANGSQIISQTPSAITVAYLRQGLTAQGLTKPPAYPPVTTSA